MKTFYFFEGKTKDLLEDVRQHLTEEEELIALQDEGVNDPE